MSQSNKPTTTSKQGVSSLDQLIWDHQNYENKLKEKFLRFLNDLIDKSKNAYDSATQRIIMNTIVLLYKKAGVLPSKVYIEDYNRSDLNLLFVFPKTDFDKKANDLYTAMPSIQELAILNESRDFKWHFTSDEYLNEDLLEQEYNYCVTAEG
jgi:hypothetical protein